MKEEDIISYLTIHNHFSKAQSVPLVAMTTNKQKLPHHLAVNLISRCVTVMTIVTRLYVNPIAVMNHISGSARKKELHLEYKIAV